VRRAKCGCPDPNDAQHCLLLQDFPGGFYGDMEASRDEFCECSCHEPDPDDDYDGSLAPDSEGKP
jgi:hypothetical protein